MGPTPRQLNRATLSRQQLLDRDRMRLVDAVNRAVALQAQEPASPYIALWNRVTGFDPSDLDAAFASYAIVKATLIRITLHAVDTADYTTFHEAMLKNLRASRLGDRRFTSTGLTIADADALVPHLVEFTSRPRTKDEIEDMLAGHLGAPPERGVWWALRTFAPLIHVPTGPPWSFGSRPSFLAAPTEPDRQGSDRSLQGLIWRYLEGFGPASVEDFAQFAMQQRSAVRQALEAMSDMLTRVDGPSGKELFDIPGVPLPAEDTPSPPRLLGMWDNILLAYADRSRVIPEQYRQLVTRRNGDVLPTLLVDGYVCGVWRPVEEGIEALAFNPLAEGTWAGLASEARGLVAMLADRDPTVYARYAHWWSELPSAEVRILPG